MIYYWGTSQWTYQLQRCSAPAWLQGKGARVLKLWVGDASGAGRWAASLSGQAAPGEGASSSAMPKKNKKKKGGDYDDYDDMLADPVPTVADTADDEFGGMAKKKKGATDVETSTPFCGLADGCGVGLVPLLATATSHYMEPRRCKT